MVRAKESEVGNVAVAQVKREVMSHSSNSQSHQGTKPNFTWRSRIVDDQGTGRLWTVSRVAWIRFASVARIRLLVE
jgi:hypothetical protein